MAASLELDEPYRHRSSKVVDLLVAVSSTTRPGSRSSAQIRRSRACPQPSATASRRYPDLRPKSRDPRLPSTRRAARAAAAWAGFSSRRRRRGSALAHTGAHSARAVGTYGHERGPTAVLLAGARRRGPASTLRLDEPLPPRLFVGSFRVLGFSAFNARRIDGPLREPAILLSPRRRAVAGSSIQADARHRCSVEGRSWSWYNGLVSAPPRSSRSALCDIACCRGTDAAAADLTGRRRRRALVELDGLIATCRHPSRPPTFPSSFGPANATHQEGGRRVCRAGARGAIRRRPWPGGRAWGFRAPRHRIVDNLRSHRYRPAGGEQPAGRKSLAALATLPCSPSNGYGDGVACVIGSRTSTGTTSASFVNGDGCRSSRRRLHSRPSAHRRHRLSQDARRATTCRRDELARNHGYQRATSARASRRSSIGDRSSEKWSPRRPGAGRPAPSAVQVLDHPWPAHRAVVDIETAARSAVAPEGALRHGAAQRVSDAGATRGASTAAPRADARRSRGHRDDPRPAANDLPASMKRAILDGQPGLGGPRPTSCVGAIGDVANSRTRCRPASSAGRHRHPCADRRRYDVTAARLLPRQPRTHRRRSCTVSMSSGCKDTLATAELPVWSPQAVRATSPCCCGGDLGEEAEPAPGVGLTWRLRSRTPAPAARRGAERGRTGAGWSSPGASLLTLGQLSDPRPSQAIRPGRAVPGHDASTSPLFEPARGRSPTASRTADLLAGLKPRRGQLPSRLRTRLPTGGRPTRTGPRRTGRRCGIKPGHSRIHARIGPRIPVSHRVRPDLANERTRSPVVGRHRTDLLSTARCCAFSTLIKSAQVTACCRARGANLEGGDLAARIPGRGPHPGRCPGLDTGRPALHPGWNNSWAGLQPSAALALRVTAPPGDDRCSSRSTPSRASRSGS